MNSFKILIIGLFIIIKPLISVAVSEAEAKKILGNNFISTAETFTAWNKTTETKIDINYSTEELKAIAVANNNGKRYYLVPTIGITGCEIKNLWSGSIPLDIESRKHYWLVDWTKVNPENEITSYLELKSVLDESKETALKMIEILEIISTIKETRGVNVSPNMSIFWLNDEWSDKNSTAIVAYSTFTNDQENLLVTINVPKNQMLMSGFVLNGTVYYSYGNELENISIIPTPAITGITRKTFVFKIAKSP